MELKVVVYTTDAKGRNRKTMIQKGKLTELLNAAVYSDNELIETGILDENGAVDALEALFKIKDKEIILRLVPETSFAVKTREDGVEEELCLISFKS